MPRNFGDVVGDVLPVLPSIIDSIWGEGTTEEQVSHIRLPLPDIRIWGMNIGTVALIGFAALAGLIILTRK